MKQLTEETRRKLEEIAGSVESTKTDRDNARALLITDQARRIREQEQEDKEAAKE